MQIGGNIGRMVLDIFRLKGDEARHTLLATGAAAGLAAAFNAEIFKRIQILRDMGVGLSVDDFGTGFSGLSRLVSLPVTEIMPRAIRVTVIGNTL